MIFSRLVSIAAWIMITALIAAVTVMIQSVFALFILILMIVLPLLSIPFNRIAKNKIKAELILPSSARKSKSCEGSVYIFCDGIMPSGKVFSDVVIRNDLTGERAKIRLAMEPDKNGYRADFSVNTNYCGRIVATIEKLYLFDFFGITALDIQISVTARSTVFPETFAVDISNAEMSAMPSDSEEYCGKGTDLTEIFQLREYENGDALGAIHWKLSSKLDKLIVREPSKPISHSMLVYWDQCCEEADKTDALAETFFSVCNALCEAGCRFTVGRTAGNNAQLEEITDADELMSIMPSMLYKTEDNQYLPDFSDYGRVFLFTARNIGKAENIAVFSCADGGDICFTTENYAEVMRRLDLGYGK